MTNGANIYQLREYILQDKSLQAEEFVRHYPLDSEPVLEGFSHSDNTDVRRIIVELAGINPSLKNCRLLLKRLSDSDIEIKELAVALISRCHHKEMLPELVEALDLYTEPDILSALVLLIGQEGDKNEIKPLNELRKKIKDEPDLDHDLSIALARLGDPKAIEELHQRLSSDVDPTDRVSALNDCIYVADKEIVAHFGPALNDYRDMVALSIPENPPMEFARVVDIAVYVMVQLGVVLSYPLEELKRLSYDQLEEASQYVQSVR